MMGHHQSIYSMVGRWSVLQVVSGNKAGAFSVLLDVEKSYSQEPKTLAELQPDLVVQSLADLKAQLRSTFHLQAR